ncbi:MAG: hypothetical protein EOO28_28215 [Comamonadaceae bacterium]|nr:MAG: hypothetical protein EOO28_28215 [Comamonadaceae bacterium]
MAKGKTTTLTFRIGPPLKESQRVAAEREHRSITNRGEVMIGSTWSAMASRSKCSISCSPKRLLPVPTDKALIQR